MAQELYSHEFSAIRILEIYFSTAISVITPVDSYKRKTADIIIHNVEWEIKSPQTSSLKTLETRFKEAGRQSKYIVIDLRRSKLNDSAAINRLGSLLIQHKRIRRVLCISKSGDVIEIKRRPVYNK